jgi:hypothetical protein
MFTSGHGHRSPATRLITSRRQARDEQNRELASNGWDDRAGVVLCARINQIRAEPQCI